MKEVIGKQINREKNDFYATNPNSVKDIIELENIKNMSILENSAGCGNIAKELLKYNNSVFTIDIINRNYPLDLQIDFLLIEKIEGVKFDCAVYNPPFKLLKEFILHTFKFTNIQYVFSRLQALEGIARFKEIYSKNYLEIIYIYVKRTSCAKDNNIEYYGKSNSIAFCWLKFNKNFTGETKIKWIYNNK